MRKSNLLVWLLIVGHIMGLFSQSVVMAQSSTPADKLPVIEHDAMTAPANDPFTFTAKVTDDSKVANVTLLYRFKDAVEYQRLAMNAANDGVTYEARIPQSDRRDGIIQYYFVAFDDRGNAKVSHFSFEPLNRSTVLADTTLVTEAPAAVDKSAEPVTKSRKIKPLHILFGVLAVGAVAALAGGGGDSSSPPSAEGCAGSGCSIRLVLPTP